MKSDEWTDDAVELALDSYRDDSEDELLELDPSFGAASRRETNGLEANAFEAGRRETN